MSISYEKHFYSAEVEKKSKLSKCNKKLSFALLFTKLINKKNSLFCLIKLPKLKEPQMRERTEKDAQRCVESIFFLRSGSSSSKWMTEEK